MKIEHEDFEALKRDYREYVRQLQAEKGPNDYFTMRAAWVIFNLIEDDRRYDDSHPMYVQGLRMRRIPFVARGATLYNKGLNDAHIETALRKIVAA